MIYGIDHMVIVLPNLQSAIAHAQEAGFTVEAGGTHADGITHNALIGLADGTYIELISPTAWPTHQHHRWFGRLDHGGGLIDMCLLSDNLEADTRLMRERERLYSAPLAGGRSRLDGVRLQWKGSFPPGEVGVTGWPFLIEDVTPRILRVPQSPMQVSHPNGARGIAEVVVLVKDISAAQSDFEAITDIEAVRSTDHSATLQFPNHQITLLQPEHGPLLDRLNQYGPGPISLTLHRGTQEILGAHGTTLDLGMKDGTAVILV